MRIVEPSRYDHHKKNRNMPTRFVLVCGVVMGVLILALGVFWISRNTSSDQQNESVQQPKSTNVNSQSSSHEVSESVGSQESMSPVTTAMRIFAPNDFKLFYDQLQQPNLTPVANPPAITGNVEADARIRIIAERRGYRLRSSPRESLPTVDGFPMQSIVGPDWLALKAAAQAEGLGLSVVSAYRSVEQQRTLFLSRLGAAGAGVESVAAGQADDAVNSVLITSSIPGYSKHHTGYTLDFLCAGWQFENFKNSPCNAWISADNYKIAKEHGFIPSYPIGADAQGPDPEAWEYVWVGVNQLYERR